MSYEPIDLENDTTHLKNALMEVGRLASTYVSRAAVEHGNTHPVTELFDRAAQSITVALLELHTGVAEMNKPVVVEPFVSDGL